MGLTKDKADYACSMMKVGNKTRLCVVVTNLQRAYDLVNSLARKYETHVIYVAYPITREYIGDISKSYDSYPVKYPYKSGSLVEASNLKSITFIPLLVDIFMKIRRVVQGNNIDLIHAHWAIPSGFLASLAGSRIPLITTIMGSDVKVQGKRRMFQPFVKYALKKSTKVIAVSNDLKQEAIELGTAANKICVIPGGVDTRKFKPLDKCTARSRFHLPEGFLILFVGSLMKIKRVDRLISVSARLSKDSSFHVLIVGDGPDRANLENLARDLGLKNIVFTSTVPHGDIPFYMVASDVLILPSESEGLPGCVQEAMACGIPVVASNVGGLPDIITNEVNGYLINDESEMEERLRLMMSSPHLTAMMGVNALEFAKQNLSLDMVAKQTEDLYVSVLDGK